ncbi:MAG: GC-type dockerin domain-anchored protein [Phycisphaerales bacterium JB039]
MNGWVLALQAVHERPIGPALYVGGEFSRAGGHPSRCIAKWIADRCRPDLDGSGALDFFDFLAFQNLFAVGDLRADFTGDGALDVFDYLAFFNEFEAGCP